MCFNVYKMNEQRLAKMNEERDLLERLDEIYEQEKIMPILTDMVSRNIQAFVSSENYQAAVDLWHELRFIQANTVGDTTSAGIRLFVNVTNICKEDLIHATRKIGLEY